MEKDTTELTLSATMKYAMKVLKRAYFEIKHGKCDEDEVEEIITKLNPESHGYIKPSDYCNTDEALKILGFGANRNRLFTLTKKYGIENHRVNNVPIGFKKAEIERLKMLLDKGIDAPKRKRKRGQTMTLDETFESLDIQE